MDKFYNLTEKQAKCLADEKPEKLTFLAILPEQPSVGYIYDNIVRCFRNNRGNMYEPKLPYPLGSIVRMCRIIANPTNRALQYGEYEVTGGRVCRVQDVIWQTTEAGIPFYFTGCSTEKEFIDEFNGRYSKPRPRQKNGVVTHYECWSYDINSWESLYGESVNLIRAINTEYWFYWMDSKGRYPLIIHVNPWVQLIEGERR